LRYLASPSRAFRLRPSLSLRTGFDKLSRAGSMMLADHSVCRFSARKNGTPLKLCHLS